MVDQIVFYISAAKDVEAEREVLARLTTEIPVTLGWRIFQSPIRGERLEPASVISADVHVLILGTDIRAPIGVEWMLSRKSGRRIYPFAKSTVLRTPAAEEFIRLVRTSEEWLPYKDPQDLRLTVMKLLADHLIKNAAHYALRPGEYERLIEWRQELEEKKAEPEEVIQREAGASSVIFSRERYVPSQGILLGRSEVPEKPAKEDEKQ
jgi:hypothetical protein